MQNRRRSNLSQIIECVPNFSEGKNKKKINAIKFAILKVKNIKVLDVHFDADHNRCVITFIGPPEDVIEATFQSVKKAAQLIDLTKHKGEHPRIGATDVVPLIPLKGINFNECIKYAKKLGARIGNELKIPVYLYEKAAQSSERKNLANIRNKNYKGKPDFGPLKRSKAGATVVGVRDILVAYNVNIDSKNLKIAKAIAKKIREKNGGLKNLKALGIPLKSRGIVQVSMNLTNYKKTSPLKAFSSIEKLAKKYGVKILESEVVGMIPAKALPKNYKKVLKLKRFKKSQILKKA